MPAPARFADAVAKVEDARVVLYGVPYDRTCSFRGGARWAPNAIREASYNFETYMMDHDRDILDVAVADLGNLEEFAAPPAMVDGVRKVSRDLAKRGQIAIAIGGEHGIAPPAVHGFDRDIGVIGIDAHLDFRASYLDEKWSHACSQRRIADHVGVDHTVYIGVRSFSKEEKEDLERLGVTYVSAFEIHARGMKWAIERALEVVDRDRVYLTIDMDGIDPAYAPAVGNPEPFGLTPLQTKEAIDLLAPHLVGMDLNEVSPMWDQGQTALLAARLVREAIISAGRKGR